MYKIAVLGDKDSVLGFKALGLDTFPVESVDGIPVGGRDPERLALLQRAYLGKFHRETAG